MKIRLDSVTAPLTRSELVLAFALDKSVPDLGQSLADAVRRAKATGDLNSETRKFSLFHRVDGAKGEPKRLGFVGLGQPKKVDAEALRRAAAVGQAQADAVGVAAFDLIVTAADHGSVTPFAAGMSIAEGLVLGAYRYEPPRKEAPKARRAQRASVRYLAAQGSSQKQGTRRDGAEQEFARGLRLGVIAAEATVAARDLENMPGNLANPSHLATEALKLQAGKAAAGKAQAGKPSATRIAVRVLEKRDMERLKMGALLGVARGSVEPPKLIVLDHKPAGARKTVCIVGKGLTFDSGGISIKPSAKMDEMRYDMCGAGAVLGLFHAIARGGLAGTAGKVRIVGVIAAAENMPDAAAQKPGDVVRAMDGTTIEVLNTDAEGRLVLADALAYAIKTFAPERIVDLATLTGAVIVALGHEAAGVMGNDEALIRELIDAGRAADEPLWQLPLWDAHREQVKSKFADLANINGAGHGNGTIAGAAFLAHFVGETPWAHLDIAGTAWGGRAKDYYRSGAAGTAVRTLLHWCRSLS